MDRIRDEMAAHPEDGMLQTIGEHLTAYLQAHPDTELKAGATMQGAMKSMMNKARGSQVNGMAAMSFIDGMKLVYEHMGLPWSKKECMRVQLGLYDAAAPEITKPDPQARADEFELDALLGGL